MEIKPNDIISGATYLKLLNDYREYDKRQKETIRKLKNDVISLTWEVEDLRAALEDDVITAHNKLLAKLNNQRMGIKAYLNKIEKFKKEIESLNASLSNKDAEIENLKAQLEKMTK